MRSSLQERDDKAERLPPRIWNVALLWGEIPFLVLLLLGEVFALGQYVLARVSFSLLDAARLGGLYFYSFNHVAIHADVVRAGARQSFFSLSVAFLTVTAIAIGLLFIGGTRVGKRVTGSPLVKTAAGAGVALPYAVLSLMISYAVPVSFHLPAHLEGGELAVGVSHLQAFLWPLAIGAVAGPAGGLWSARDERAPSRIASALGGGVRMLLYGMGASLVALLVVGAIDPGSVRTYFHDTVGNGKAGTDLLVHHALVLPNQSMWVLVPAMGACDRVEGAAGKQGPQGFLCYSRFPRHGQFLSTLGSELGSSRNIPSPIVPITFTRAPVPYLLFLLVPLIAVVAGGVAAGRAAGSRGEAAVAGAFAGVAFALLVAGVSLLAGIDVHLAGGGNLTVGPDPVGGSLLALGWGVAGGATGAAIAFGRST